MHSHPDLFPGINAQSVPVRSYPARGGENGAHVLGYVGSVNEEDLADKSKNYFREETIGKDGLELQYDDYLRGKVSGVQVTQNAGAPGSGISVKIRGTNSLRGNNEPLYVVDGVIISSAGEDVLAAGGVAQAFKLVKAKFPNLPLEVEVDSLQQLREVVEAGADLILLDNMTIEECRAAVEIVSGRAKLEASGGLILSNARAYAKTGVDYLAVGALTHSAPVLDIGLDLRME